MQKKDGQKYVNEYLHLKKSLIFLFPIIICTFISFGCRKYTHRIEHTVCYSPHCVDPDSELNSSMILSSIESILCYAYLMFCLYFCGKRI